MTDLERYNKDKATVMSMIKFILMLLIIIALLFFATKVIGILVPFIIGFLLAKTSFAIANPIARKFSKPSSYKAARRKISKSVYVILLIIIVLLFFLVGLLLWDQATKAIASLTNFASHLDTSYLSTDFLHKLSSQNGGFLPDAMVDFIEENIYTALSTFAERIPSLLTGIWTAFWNMIGNIPYGIFVVISVILSGYYFINEGPAVLKSYLKTVPNKSFRMKSVSLLNDLSVTLFRALGGYLSLLIITAVEAWAAFKIAGMKYAIILALITAIIDFLPVLGVSATMIPAMIYLAFHDNFTGIVVLIISMAIMTVIRRIIEPAILGKSLHLHPLLMLIGMALGVYIWGAIGFLLGPTVFIIIMDIFKVFAIDKKITSFMSRVLGNFMKNPEEEKASETAGK